MERRARGRGFGGELGAREGAHDDQLDIRVLESGRERLRAGSSSVRQRRILARLAVGFRVADEHHQPVALRRGRGRQGAPQRDERDGGYDAPSHYCSFVKGSGDK